jgi:hypothetical protein
VTAVFAVVALVLSGLLPAAPAQAQAADWAPPSTVYIPETGQSLDQLFLDLWRGGGGAAPFGNPITPELPQADGHVVQYLEYARFEYWPEGDASGNTVLLGKLGEELRPMTVSRSIAAFTAPTSQGGGTSAAAVESAKQMKAWLPVAAPATDSLLYVAETQHTIGGGFLTFWQATGGADYLGNPLTEEYTLGGVTYQVFERGQLAWQQGKDPWLVPVGKVLADKYQLDQTPIAQGDLPAYSEDLFIPPPEPTPEPTIIAEDGVNDEAVNTGELWIDVNLSTQYMVVYSGNAVVFETYISSGRDGFNTPTGTFFINSMLPSQDMEGVIGGEYYNVPEVPDVMYFTGEGHAIHGAYWHNNFGSPMSHGCINMPLDMADYLYSIATVGTRVEIHY